jgi:hypothetical protein
MFRRNSFLAPVDETPSGGAGGDTSQSPAGNSESGSADESKYVPVDAYKRIQADLKKWKDRARENESKVNAWEAEKSQQADQKAIEEKRFQEVLEKQKAENEALKSQLGEYESSWQKAQKYNAVAQFLGNDFDSKYADLIDFNSIEVEEDGSVNVETAKQTAERFKQEHPRLFLNPSRQTPGHYPNGGGSKLSANEFNRLGSSKEMLRKISERFPELDRK